jgi:acyl carrier protein
MEEKLLSIIRDILENQSLDVNVSQSNCDDWDSMAHLNIIIAVEEEFEISIEPDDITEIKSFIDFKQYLRRS